MFTDFEMKYVRVQSLNFSPNKISTSFLILKYYFFQDRFHFSDVSISSTALLCYCMILRSYLGAYFLLFKIIVHLDMCFELKRIVFVDYKSFLIPLKPHINFI